MGQRGHAGRNIRETSGSRRSNRRALRSDAISEPPRGVRMFSSAEELLAYVKDEGIEIIDVRFSDLPGIMQHFTVPVSSFGPEVFEEGLMFDGSSVRGFQQIHESDMKLLPDPTTAFLDTFRGAKTLAINFFVHDPLTGEAVQPRPAQHRPQGAGVPEVDRDRGHRVLRARGRVLRLRRRPVRDQAEHRLLLDRLDRRRLEHRPDRGRRQPRLQGPLQGRLLPGRADRPLRRPARPDHAEPGEVRPAGRARPTTRSAPRVRRRSTSASTSC